MCCQALLYTSNVAEREIGAHFALHELAQLFKPLHPHAPLFPVVVNSRGSHYKVWLPWMKESSSGLGFIQTKKRWRCFHLVAKVERKLCLIKSLQCLCNICFTDKYTSRAHQCRQKDTPASIRSPESNLCTHTRTHPWLYPPIPWHARSFAFCFCSQSQFFLKLPLLLLPPNLRPLPSIHNTGVLLIL